jgi:hypothetical protein
MEHNVRRKHVLDVWYFHTGEDNSSVPFCTGSGGFNGKAECSEMFANASGLENGRDHLTARLDCQTHVSVPDYYLNTMSNMTSDLITQDTNGELIFTGRVCSCRIEKGLSGPQCSPQGIGYVFLIALVMIGLMLFARLVLAIKMVVDGTLLSRKKKFLISLAAFQHVGQIMWLIGWLDQYFILIDRVTMVTYTGNLGFTFATLFMFMFICELASQTSAFLRKDAEGGLENRLKWLERVFSVMPFAAVFMTWLFVFDPTTKSRIRLLIFQSIILVSVVSAFSFVVHILNKKVTRLLPRVDEKLVEVKSSASLLDRLRKTNLTKPRTRLTLLDSTSEQLLASSKRLRHMALSLRIYLLLYAVLGGMYVYLENLDDTPSRIVRTPNYCLWQFIMSSIPTASIGGLAIMNKVPKMIRGTSIRLGIKGTSISPECSSVGTLTS